ncbi:ester cyclase [Streptomyces sp. NPDC020801]|uniref:ester cyclase n=1 Tax=unclassified Streptomyces TaxID=2593676 RepID=UPI00378B980A
MSTANAANAMSTAITVNAVSTASTVNAENKERCLRMVAAWNRWDVAGVVEHWAPDVVHYTEEGGQHDTRELIERMESAVRAFPDLHLDVKSILAEGDRVMLRITVTATHLGEFMGLAPTGRRVAWHYLEELRFSPEGEVVEHWDVFNFAPLFRAIGQVPAGM